MLIIVWPLTRKFTKLLTILFESTLLRVLFAPFVSSVFRVVVFVPLILASVFCIVLLISVTFLVIKTIIFGPCQLRLVLLIIFILLAFAFLFVFTAFLTLFIFFLLVFSLLFIFLGFFVTKGLHILLSFFIAVCEA